MPEYVFAQGDVFTTDSIGQMVHLTEGKAFAADDPIVRAHPELFGEHPPLIHRTDGPAIETATANPGEKRNVRRG